ncbi:hypothetical protein M0Q97_10985 [Candidatus Dojkabacteria bacterium]|jgi:ribonuclease HI|nr:hypothetical protein [Candidatus Dojkabacteria bacterium]
MNLDIFTDCSGGKSFGIAILYLENELEYTFKSKVTRHMIDGSVELGEFYAIIKSLQLIDNKYDKITIYTDSLNCYNYINGFSKVKPLSNKKINIIKRHMLNNYSKIVENLNVEVRHIKAHCDVYGNEKCDKMAKIAKK